MVVDMPYGSAPSLVSSARLASRRPRGSCADGPMSPVQVWSGLAMNVSPKPFSQAISLAPCLKSTLRSADLQDVVVADVHLVLAGRRLALAELDRDAGLGHQVAQQPVERLGLGRLEQVVVLVVVAEALEADEALAASASS